MTAGIALASLRRLRTVPARTSVVLSAGAVGTAALWELFGAIATRLPAGF
jgi:hypothetical protein